VTSQIVTGLKQAGVAMEAIPKLKSGHGESVCQVLHALCKKALQKQQVVFEAPEWPDEGFAEEAEVDSDAEVKEIDEEDANLDDDEEEVIYSEMIDKKKQALDDSEDFKVVEAQIDPHEWAIELEQVGPQLRVTMPTDAQEWRAHLSQTKEYKHVIEETFPPAKTQLEKLGAELASLLERIHSKEAFINSQFENRAADYQAQQSQLKEIREQYDGLNETVMNLTIELRVTSEQLDKVKNEMEERSSTVTDHAPVVKLKDAVKRLKADTLQMELRIGVVNHTLMQAKLRQRPANRRGNGPGLDAYEED